jgi:hypothetical protein
VTTLNEAREAIYDRWKAEWDATVFEFDNQSKKLHEGSVNFARVTVRNLSSAQETLGAAGQRHFRRRGAVFVQIFTPENKGLKAGDDLAQEAREIFEGVSFDGLDFSGALVRESGADGKWFMHMVEATFDYDEIK